ncbi:MAG: hypothetical protein JO053_07825 [Acidobacteria bacterium]|nr:hypothetical protein [Acidobacteriota bacterium]MBV9216068.1 hypothetical protein [Acidobacteriota bacterium]
MASHKHTDSAADLSRPYEENDVRLKGILGFGVGLVLLILITFGLMWAFLNQMKAFNAPDPNEASPMAMSDKEKLPPEPRLQDAPGFGVEGPHGRVNMELVAPSAEYREMKKEWADLWEHGQKDEKTGTVSVLPIDQAIDKVLTQNVKAKSGADVEKNLDESRMIVTDASAGRMTGLKRR